MVQNPRKTLRADIIRLNMPERVQVREDIYGLPTEIRTKIQQSVVAIEDKWRIDDEWWRIEPVSRVYYSVVLSSGQKMMVYKNLVANCWYRQT
jgi:hypothetical protein